LVALVISLAQQLRARVRPLGDRSRESEEPYFGWLSTAIPGYERTVGLKVNVLTQPLGTRPHIRLLAQEHPLYRDQIEGISWERACDLSHAAF
jgi:hypothetical protein